MSFIARVLPDFEIDAGNFLEVRLEITPDETMTLFVHPNSSMYSGRLPPHSIKGGDVVKVEDVVRGHSLGRIRCLRFDTISTYVKLNAGNSNISFEDVTRFNRELNRLYYPQ
ncbi:uncharacterized protein PSANT_06325 [Moesziomyces antarcticus]|uniref:Uncharacterized protein n=1 Tax=Pseudozyma antarctica TaxID=84753 RepID=A0A5C3FWA3_PSEA2|nr:uncharacterized protein PSANT_06325 [Moesziomyces antarcticus]